MCGGTLEIIEGQTVCECEYCGTKQTVPSLDNEKKEKLYERANRLRFNNEFDRAYSVYQDIVADYPEDAEAYWGLILCKYGIEYVEDPSSGKRIPTCHRSSFDSLIDNPNYSLVMENADKVAREVYRDEAKQIEQIRKGIIEVASKEEPYDIFICYKETDENGERTIDSVLAQDVYDALTAKGYRVFFSRISLEDKLGQEYEPYVFAALNSAKVMLAFGTDFDYYNAVWVKNEWSRYLQMMEKDNNKHLIPCFKGIDVYDMPKEFHKLQSQDMGKVGAVQDLLRGIEKLLKPVAISSQTISNEEIELLKDYKEQHKNQKWLPVKIIGTIFVLVGLLITMLIVNYQLLPGSYYGFRPKGLLLPNEYMWYILFDFVLLGSGMISHIFNGFKSKTATVITVLTLLISDFILIYIRLNGYASSYAVSLMVVILVLYDIVAVLFAFKGKKSLSLSLAVLLIGLSSATIFYSQKPFVCSDQLADTVEIVKPTDYQSILDLGSGKTLGEVVPGSVFKVYSIQKIGQRTWYGVYYENQRVYIADLSGYTVFHSHK